MPLPEKMKTQKYEKGKHPTVRAEDTKKGKIRFSKKQS